MTALLMTIYVVVCVLLILAVLIQQGKGASMGLLSGAGQTWFGPAGSKTLLMKITLGLAAGFLALSVLLALATSSSRRNALAAATAAPGAPAAPSTPPPSSPSVPPGTDSVPKPASAPK